MVEENLKNQDLISSVEAAGVFGITNDYVTMLCRQGKVGGQRIGNRVWFVNQTDLRAYLALTKKNQELRSQALSQEYKEKYRASQQPAVVVAPIPAQVATPAVPSPWTLPVPVAAALVTVVLTASGAAMFHMTEPTFATSYAQLEASVASSIQNGVGNFISYIGSLFNRDTQVATTPAPIVPAVVHTGTTTTTVVQNTYPVVEHTIERVVERSIFSTLSPGITRLEFNDRLSDFSRFVVDMTNSRRILLGGRSSGSSGGDTFVTNITGSGSTDPEFTLATNYGVAVSATSTPLWLQAGLFASSTSHFADADFINATTTSLAITNLAGFAGECLTVNASGSVTTTACLSGGGTFPFDPTTFGSTNANATSTLIGFTAGLYSLASSTIGDGTQTGGLTISGGATTTGNAYFGGNLGLGRVTPSSRLDIVGSATSSPVITLRDPLGGVSFEIRAGTSSLSNAFVGIDAGRSITTGFWNTGMGNYALYSNTTGGQNTAVGYLSLFANTTGIGNTAMGRSALAANLSGYENTAIGYSSLLNNTTGNENTALGSSVLRANTTGSDNTGVGYASLISNTTGNNNIGLGRGSLFGNLTGSQNIAVGHNALVQSNVGTNNVALGFQAGYSITSGYANILLGAHDSLSNVITTGDGNVGLGNELFFPSVTANNQLNIGNLVYGTLPATTTSLTQPTAGVIGIGTSSPYARLSVHGVNGSTIQTLFAIGSTTGSTHSTLFSVSNTGAASTTQLYGAGLTSCTSNNVLTWSNGLFGCEADDSGSGGADFAWSPTTFGATNANATSTLIGFTAGLYSLASSTIGDGTQAGGLTINGGATTTGTAVFGGTVNFNNTAATIRVNGAIKLDYNVARASSWNSTGSFYTDTNFILSNSAGAYMLRNGLTSISSPATGVVQVPGLLTTASSTIGDGTQAGGLTISGGATTTGDAYFNSNLTLTDSSKRVVATKFSNAATAGNFFLTTSGLFLRNNAGLYWANSSNAEGTSDLGLARQSAGVLQITNASTGNGGLLALASSTIGDGTQAGGLTVSGAATTTYFFGAGLSSCTSNNVLTWSNGLFGCEADDSGSGGAAFAYTPTTSFGQM